MKKVFALVCLILVTFALAVVSFAHPGNTDSNGGHYNRDTGEYHYHHGYLEHQHENGVCPFEETEIEWSCDEDGCTIEGEHYHLKDFGTTEATTETTTEPSTTEAITEPPTTENEQKQEKNYEFDDILLCLCIGVLCLISLWDLASKKLKK